MEFEGLSLSLLGLFFFGFWLCHSNKKYLLDLFIDAHYFN